MHVIAALGWDYAHIDEIRAFLKAPYKEENKAYVNLEAGSNTMKSWERFTASRQLLVITRKKWHVAWRA